VLCHGNICRSPFAAGLLDRALAGTVQVTSAGFVGPGRGSPPEALSVAAEYGVDLTGHRSQLITSEMLHAAGVAIVMNVRQRAALVSRYGAGADRVLLLGDFDPEPIDTRTVPDPVDQPRAAFEASYARIARCVEAMARSVRPGR
jgi:protein-tyrosine phosphatase